MTSPGNPGAPAVRLSCPICGSPMNRHAEKIDTRLASESAGDDALGGVLCEILTCPTCRYVVERRVAELGS